MSQRLLALGLLSLTSCVSLSGPTPSAGTDEFVNFAALASHKQENIDYRISINDHHAKQTVWAIHGGTIEHGTSELAREVAGDSLNSYLFEGLNEAAHSSLHITSAHFDEPQALALAQRSERCLSLHGYRSDDVAVCVGGGDRRLEEQFTKALSAFQQTASIKFQIITPCTKFSGQSPKNIVNRCQHHGVQIELSNGLRDRLSNDSLFRSSFATLLRSTLMAP